MLERVLTSPPNEARAALLLAAATLLYLVYHFAIKGRLPLRFAPPDPSDDQRRTAVAFFRKVVGAVVFGIVPMVAIALAWPGGLRRCGLTFEEAGPSALYALAFAVIVAPFIWRQAKTPEFRRHYPEVRLPFTPRIEARNALAWAAYLLGYEFFFRGVLVLALSHEIGPAPALAASLIAYVFAHLDRYAGELLGTLVTGTLFSLVALHTGSILAPFLAHLLTAVWADHCASRPLK